MERNFVQEETSQPTSARSNSKYYVIIISLLIVALLAGLIYFFKILSKPEMKINAKVNKSEIYLNEELIYADNTQGAVKWKWEFGDGKESKVMQGTYKFQKTGSYVVRLTVNDQLREQFLVTVKDTIPFLTLDSDTSLFISGPTSGMILEEVRLEANGAGEIFEWWFGESGKVDAIGRSALYTYSRPGRYYVKLRSDKSAEFSTHMLDIVDPSIDLNEVITPGKGAQEALNDLKESIQAIANGTDFESKYNYILSKYLCNNEKVKVTVEMDGAKKIMDVYAYLMGLTFSKGVTIADVTVESASNPNENRECPTLIKVKQSK